MNCAFKKMHLLAFFFWLKFINGGTWDNAPCLAFERPIAFTLKVSCFLRLKDWRVSMFSYFYFKCWQTRGRPLKFWKGYQNLYIAITWFSDNVQAGKFVAKHEGFIKMDNNLLNRRLITYIIKAPKHALKS